MSEEPREVNASRYTFSGNAGWTKPKPIEYVYQVTYFDENGMQCRPVRNGEIIGGRYDGLRVAPPQPPMPFSVDPASVSIRFEPDA